MSRTPPGIAPTSGPPVGPVPPPDKELEMEEEPEAQPPRLPMERIKRLIASASTLQWRLLLLLLALATAIDLLRRNLLRRKPKTRSKP